MNTKEAITALKRFNKYICGRGRKYIQPNCPVGMDETRLAIRIGIDALTNRICREDFELITNAAGSTLIQIETFIKAVDKGKIKNPAKDVIDFARKRYPLLKRAHKNASRVCRTFAKKDAE